VSIRRAVPNVQSDDVAASRMFYVDVLGFEVSMDEGSFVLFAAPGAPDMQVSVNETPTGSQAGFAVDVGSPERVAEIHAACVASGLSVVEELDDKPWGIRRFGVLDPSGVQVTVLAHL
jgi:catechol 2,3-dioxygenase-like lactoylglutathione lyase family enzyme